ncbi:MAG: hypothetical protein NC123_07830 [Butyrivibrio sp.]|nr:hypothetical protein [Acetatifactor muris]MCM1559441.1 hypothetical protein [Butyrivibrio sp.]
MSQSREVLFARTLEEVRAKAREQGNCLSKEQVREAFAGQQLGEEQLQMVFDYLVKHKVGIGQPVDPDEYLTDEERNYLQNYMDEIAALPTYSRGELEAVTLSAMAGEAEAQQKLVHCYLKDAVDIARLYAGQGVFLEDLIGEGNLALTMGVSMLGSLEKPSEAPGMLARLMMDAMEDYIRENAANEKTDRKVADKVNLVADKAGELAEALHRKVTPEELARESGLSLKSILDACRMSGYKIEDIQLRSSHESDSL